MCCCQRVNAVPEQSQSAWPGGQSINHSTNDAFSLRLRHVPLRNHLRRTIGDTDDIAERSSWREIGRQIEGGTPCVHVLGSGCVKKWAAWVGSGVPPAPNDMFGPPFSPSDALGVDHRF